MVQTEIDIINEIIDNQKLTNTDKTKLFCAIGTMKTTLENLYNLYSKIEKIIGKDENIKTIESLLIENGYIKIKKTTSRKEKTVSLKK